MEPPEEAGAEQLRHWVEALEERLERSERLFQFITSITDEAVGISEQGRMLEGTARFETLFGYKLEELIGKSPVMFIAPEFHEIVVRNMQSGYDAPHEAVGVRK